MKLYKYQIKNLKKNIDEIIWLYRRFTVCEERPAEFDEKEAEDFYDACLKLTNEAQKIKEKADKK